MVEPNGSFSYDDNFNYIGERWSAIDLDGTKGYEPRYGARIVVSSHLSSSPKPSFIRSGLSRKPPFILRFSAKGRSLYSAL